MRSILVRMPVTFSPSFTTATLSSLKMSRSRAMGVSSDDHALQRLHQRLDHLGEPVLPLDEEVEQVVLVDHADGAPVVVDDRHLRDVVRSLSFLTTASTLSVRRAVMTPPRRPPSTSFTVAPATDVAARRRGKPLSRIHSSEKNLEM